MTKLEWDKVGERLYETGTDHGVLYMRNSQGVYDEAHAWNGLTAVTESPSGAESNKQYADNIVYLNLVSVEEYGGTIEAFTYPDAFGLCDGTAEPATGVSIGQQSRRTFGFSWRTLLGNDVDGNDYGYKLHLVYGALAAPSEKAYATVNDSPEPVGLSWEFTTTPVSVPGFKPSATITIDSTKVSSSALSALEDILYGTAGADGRLPLPEEVFALFTGGGATQAVPDSPTYNAGTGVITIPAVTGVVYFLNDVEVSSGALPAITEDSAVEARPAVGYVFPGYADTYWYFEAP